VIVRIAAKDLERAEKTAGVAGVNARRFWDKSGDGDAFKLVWLPEDTGLDTALEKAGRVPAAHGLVLNFRGIGVRVPKEQHQVVAAALLGAENAAAVEGDMWEMKDVPQRYGREAVSAALEDWGWAVKSVRPLRRHGWFRSWNVHAKDPPPAVYMSMSGGGVARLEKMKDSSGASSASGLAAVQPQRGSVWKDCQVPSTWASLLSKHASTGVRAQPVSSPAQPASRSMPVSVVVAASAAPTTPRAAFKTVAAASADAPQGLEAMITAAVAKAMAPLAGTVAALQATFADLQGDFMEAEEENAEHGGATSEAAGVLALRRPRLPGSAEARQRSIAPY
jgi:hypothetical protein